MTHIGLISLLTTHRLRATVAAACLFLTVTATAEPLEIIVSIPPQRYFVEQVGGENVAVTVMVPPGAEPHTYEPKPAQLLRLASSSLYFTVGFTFEEAWVERFKAVAPDIQFVPTDTGIEKLPISGRLDIGAAGNDDDEAPGTPDPHIWLSPPLVKIQARIIRDALIEADPAHADVYRANYDRFAAGLDSLHVELTGLFAAHQGATFMVFHPSWGYFAHTYGLVQLAVEIGGMSPRPADLVRLVKEAGDSNITAIFVQPEFSRRSAETIADAIGAELVVADPLAENWRINLETVARNIAAALR